MALLPQELHFFVEAFPTSFFIRCGLKVALLLLDSLLLVMWLVHACIVLLSIAAFSADVLVAIVVLIINTSASTSFVPRLIQKLDHIRRPLERAHQSFSHGILIVQEHRVHLQTHRINLLFGLFFLGVHCSALNFDIVFHLRAALSHSSRFEHLLEDVHLTLIHQSFSDGILLNFQSIGFELLLLHVHALESDDLLARVLLVIDVDIAKLE